MFQGRPSAGSLLTTGHSGTGLLVPPKGDRILRFMWPILVEIKNILAKDSQVAECRKTHRRCAGTELIKNSMQKYLPHSMRFRPNECTWLQYKPHRGATFCYILFCQTALALVSVLIEWKQNRSYRVVRPWPWIGLFLTSPDRTVSLKFYSIHTPPNPSITSRNEPEIFPVHHAALCSSYGGACFCHQARVGRKPVIIYDGHG